MKNVLRLLAVAALATLFALPVFAQNAAAPAAAPATGPCTEADAKAALYAKFTQNFKGTPEQQKTAYEAGQEYLSKYGSCPEAGDKQIATYLQGWVGKYEKAVVEFNCTKAANENPSQAFQACQPLLATNPDNLKVRLSLVGAGIKSSTSGNKSLNAQATAEARKALALIESGKTSDSWAPFANQQDAPAGLRYYIAAWTYDTAPEAAAAELLKVAQSTSALSKEPATFQLLGVSYYNGEFKKLADEYKANYEGKEETPESKALFDRINVVLDRIIDAYARAVALSNGKPAYAQINTAAKNALTTFYKQRHEGKEDGLNELIAGVLSKPLPIPGQAPAAAAPSNSGMNGTNGAAPATTTTPAATTPATNTTPAAKPATQAQKPPRS